MTRDILEYFGIHRQIFGICPRSGEFFRLSDCKVYVKTRPKGDWLDRLHAQGAHLDEIEEMVEKKKEGLRERAHTKGRQWVSRAIRKIDPVFAPHRLNPDDAKVIFHPLDYVVFKGMNEEESIKGIVFLDRVAKSPDRRRLQQSIEKVIERKRYEWVTVRVGLDGSIEEEK
jgi:predicted Holliday junction resolvase-like endonuclease